MHNCRAFDQEPGTTAKGSSGLSCQKAQGRREAQAVEMEGFCLGSHPGPRGYGAGFPQRLSGIYQNVLWTRVKFPQSVF